MAGRDERYQYLRTDLRFAGWVDVRDRFRFGYPWPWAPAPADDTQLVALRAPRSTGTAVVTVRLGEGVATGPAADRYGGHRHAVRRVRVGGVPAVVVGFDGPAGQRVTTASLAAPGGHLLHAELRVPAEVAAGYRPHFEAMLASWSWR